MSLAGARVAVVAGGGVVDVCRIRRAGRTRRRCSASSSSQFGRSAADARHRRRTCRSSCRRCRRCRAARCSACACSRSADRSRRRCRPLLSLQFGRAARRRSCHRRRRRRSCRRSPSLQGALLCVVVQPALRIAASRRCTRCCRCSTTGSLTQRCASHALVRRTEIRVGALRVECCSSFPTPVVRSPSADRTSRPCSASLSSQSGAGPPTQSPPRAGVVRRARVAVVAGRRVVRRACSRSAGRSASVGADVVVVAVRAAARRRRRRRRTRRSSCRRCRRCTGALFVRDVQPVSGVAAVVGAAVVVVAVDRRCRRRRPPRSVVARARVAVVARRGVVRRAVQPGDRVARVVGADVVVVAVGRRPPRTQAPPAQVSLVVQALSSLQGDVLSTCDAAGLPGRSRPSCSRCCRCSWAQLPPTQAPPAHVSFGRARVVVVARRRCCWTCDAAGLPGRSASSVQPLLSLQVTVGAADAGAAPSHVVTRRAGVVVVARRVARLGAVRRTRLAHAVADLGDVADAAARGAAGDARCLRRRRPGSCGAAAVAALGDVAEVGRGPAGTFRVAKPSAGQVMLGAAAGLRRRRTGRRRRGTARPRCRRRACRRRAWRRTSRPCTDSGRYRRVVRILLRALGRDDAVGRRRVRLLRRVRADVDQHPTAPASVGVMQHEVCASLLRQQVALPGHPAVSSQALPT